MSSLTEVQSFLRSGGRLFRRRQGRRTITVAYRRESDGTIQYAGTIHKKDAANQEWNRKEHNLTAVKRLKRHPVVIADAEFDRPIDRENYIREQMLRLGCFSNNESDSSAQG